MKLFSLTLCLILTSAHWLLADHHEGDATGKLLDELLASISQADEAQRYGPRMALQDLTSAASAPDSETRDAYVQLLLERLGNSETTQAAKAWILRQLENVGRAESVPALTTLMGSPFHHLRELARRALEQNPSDEAGAALRSLAEKEHDRNLRRALVYSLGQRGDAPSVGLLSEWLGSEDADLRHACITALGKIASEDSVARLQHLYGTAGPDQFATADALLESARRLTPNHAESAVSILKELYRVDQPPRIQAAALRGLLAASPDEASDRILLALQSEERLVRQAAISGCRLLGSPSVMPNVLAVKLPELSAEEQAQALAVLGDSRDVTAAAQLADALAAGELPETLEVSVIAVLGQLGGVDAADRTLDIVSRAANEDLRVETAREALSRMPGEGVDGWLLANTQTGDITRRAEAIRALGSRGYRKAVPILFAHVDRGPKAIRQVSLETLGELATGAEIPRLVAHIGDNDNRAIKALMQVCRRAVSAPDEAIAAILAAVGTQDAAGKEKLLPCLGILGGEKALAAVEGFLQDDTLKQAAMKTLTGWSGPEAGPTFIKLAGAEGIGDLDRTLALRGLVRLLESRSNGISAGDRLKFALGGIQIATRVDDKRLFLPILGNLATPEAAEALVAMLSDAELAEEAALASLSAVEKMRRRRSSRLKQQILKAVVRADVEQETAERAQKLLDGLE